MKAFIKKTILILFIFLIGIVSAIIIIKYIVRYKSDFSLSKEKKHIVFGHSHSESAFDDEIIEGFKNLSKSGETYFYTYQKIREVLPVNNVSSIFIEYSNNVITKELDEWIWEYEKMNDFFSWHSSFMDIDDVSLLYAKNRQDFLKVVSTSTRNNLTKILSFDYSISKKYGAYTDFKINIIAKEIKKAEEGNASNDTVKKQEMSIYNINYLEKIIKYCKSNNIKVFLVRSPQHKYFQKENEEELLKIKNEKYNDIDFLDFDKFPLEDNKFGDVGHMNKKGSEIFSLWFNELVKNDLLLKKNKQAFINLEMEKLQK